MSEQTQVFAVGRYLMSTVGFPQKDGMGQLLVFILPLQRKTIEF
jgi:hypothetical protein